MAFMRPASGTVRLWCAAVAVSFFLALFAQRARGDTGTQSWVKQYEDHLYPCQASGIGVDAVGNVFVAGYTGSSIFPVGDATGVVVGYSNSGLALWTNSYSRGIGTKTVWNGVAVDGFGNVIVTGNSQASTTYTWEAIKLSNAGTPLWTNRFSRGSGFAIANSVAADAMGNVFVTGVSFFTNSYVGLTTIKYSSSGQAIWTNHYASLSANSYGQCVKIDPVGDVVVAGYSVVGGNSYTYTTIKYSSSGYALWTNKFPNARGGRSGLAVDGSGGVVVTGRSPTATNGTFLTIKYSASGVPLWANNYSSQSVGAESYPMAVAVDTNNDVLVTGYATADGGVSNNYDFATIKYSSAGVPLWTNRCNIWQSNELAQAVAVDSRGSVYVSGYAWSSPTNFDFLTVKYSKGGTPLWTNRVSGFGGQSLDPWNTYVAIAPDGAAYVTGASSTGNGNLITTMKYVSAPALLSPVAKGTTNVTVSWTAIPDQAYELQSCTSLEIGNWDVATNIVASGAVVSVTVTNGLVEPQRFFRVREQ